MMPAASLVLMLGFFLILPRTGQPLISYWAGKLGNAQLGPIYLGGLGLASLILGLIAFTLIGMNMLASVNYDPIQFVRQLFWLSLEPPPQQYGLSIPPLNQGGWWLIVGLFLTASILFWWARTYRRARELGMGTHVAWAFAAAIWLFLVLGLFRPAVAQKRRQVLGPDHVPFHGVDRILDAVEQFAHVARPAVGAQDVHGRRVDGRKGQAEVPAQPPGVALGQKRHVAFPLPLPSRRDAATVVTARDGSPLRAFADAGGVWRYPATPEQVSPLYVQALLGYEDRWFWRHPGVNPVAMLRAGAQVLGKTAAVLAYGEGLQAHAQAAEFRLRTQTPS